MLLALLLAAITPVKEARAVTAAVATHKGKVVVLHIWATWCGSCIEEFPDLLKTLKDFPDVAVISVSADDPKLVDRYVQPFLTRVKMPYDTLLLDGVAPESMTQAIDSTWDGTLPATFVYNADGSLRKRFIGPAKGLRKALKSVP